MALNIDLDAIAEKRQEEIGSADKFPFVFKGQTWQCLDPMLLDDDQKTELQQLDPKDLEGTIIFYLGEEQAMQFWEVGGGSSVLTQALNIWIEHNTDRSGPTRPSTFSNRKQRRSKQP
ncbi:hypothetical protein CH300_00080 [Rhodococcus sp. 15-1154-1]|nr:hypothetical protein [Rhodococcus sp. 15-1154-1]OZF09813.1 hypothetical protein CH300_00080 [Rhodococcus sp. 15-1154-1]